MLDREELGKIVRETWVKRAQEQDNPKPAHLLPWEALDTWNQETDRQIGEAVQAAVLEALDTTINERRKARGLDEIRLILAPYLEKGRLD